jgi:hypothetical protein
MDTRGDVHQSKEIFAKPFFTGYSSLLAYMETEKWESV